MQRRTQQGESRSFGPQISSITVGGGLGILAGLALLAGVALTVPELGFWAAVVTPASAVIGVGYVLIRRWRSKPPIDLHL